MYYLKILCLIVLVGQGCCATSIFGVPPSMASLYDSSKPFTCLDGSKTIHATMVNDDYCDCDDGSDEPGTSACSFSNFYCANIGHAAMLIPSSRVNDGVCDCCDGSDERGMPDSQCANTCQELGAADRERRLQMQQIQEQGLLARQQLIEQAQLKLKQTGDELKSVQQQLLEAENTQKEKESARDQAEQLEKEFLQKYRDSTDQSEHGARELAEATFQRLDVDADGKLSVDEIREDLRFDFNNDQEVTWEDIKILAPDADQLTRDVFIDLIWPSVAASPSDSASAPSSDSSTDSSSESEHHSEGVSAEDDTLWRSQIPPEDTQSEHPEAGSDRSFSDEDGEYEEYDPHQSEEDGVDDNDHESREEEKTEEETASEPVYDTETQQVIDAAKLARDEYSASTTAVNDLRRRIDELQKVLSIEFGAGSAYAALYRQCFVLTTHEYEYKLCLFDKATQKPVGGGIETVLGQWGHWLSDAESAQMYDNGQQCWNGPKRSTEVSIRCGVETKLLEVNEPSKCVYGMVMESPAACLETPSVAPDSHSYHEEL